MFKYLRCISISARVISSFVLIFAGVFVIEVALEWSTFYFFISSDSARFILFFSVFERLISDVSLSPSSDLDYFFAEDPSTSGAILISS